MTELMAGILIGGTIATVFWMLYEFLKEYGGE